MLYILLMICVFYVCSVGGYKTLPFVSHSWMGDLKKHNSSALDLDFTSLLIPSSHDSASYAIGSDSESIILPSFINFVFRRMIPLLEPLMYWQQTQTKTIREQLDLGIRFLDFRVMSFNSTFFMSHGIVRSNLKFVDALAEIKEFLKENPDEIVSFEIHRTYFFSKEDHRILAKTILKELDGKIIRSDDYDRDLSQMTLRKVQGKEEKIIVFYRDFSKLQQEYQSMYFSSENPNARDFEKVTGTLIRPYTSRVNTIPQLYLWLKDIIRKRKLGTKRKEKGFVLPISLSWSFWQVFWGFLCNSRKGGCFGFEYPSTHADNYIRSERYLLEYLQELLSLNRDQINFVMMDHVDQRIVNAILTKLFQQRT